MDHIIPTWGYRPNGEARIFELAPGANLPDGWEATPDCITDPALATAEALTAAAAGRPFMAPGETVPRIARQGDDLSDMEATTSEIDRLKGIITAGMEENARLVAEIEKAEADLDLAATDIIAMRASLAKAQADSGVAVAERDAAVANLDALKADLAQVRADLDAASAPPKPPTKTK